MLYQGACHCKSIKFEVETELENIKQCNCSICIKKSAKMALMQKNKFKLLSGEENLSVYQFDTMVAKHFFCKKCGIYTHHFRKSDPNGMGVNAACLDGVDPFTLTADILDNK